MSNETEDEMDEFIDKALAADPLLMEVDDDQGEYGAPLSVSELVSISEALCKFQSPDDFIRATKELCGRCKSTDWFSNPHFKVLHDAYVLAECVRLTNTDAVRLAAKSEQWPDGFVKISNRIYNIEVTSAHGNRKLGDEYRTNSSPTLDPVNNWVARADSIPKYLDESIRRKIKKAYSSPCWLVVYLNISECGIRQRETEKVISETKARYEQEFHALSILWKGKLY